MKISGREIVHAPRADVWRGLNDPAILKHCIPGCDYFEREEPLLLRARMTAKLGLFTMVFAARVIQSDVVAPESCRLDVFGEGTIASLAEATAEIRLEELAPQETAVTFEVTAKVIGKLAIVGKPLINSTAQGYVERFFKRFEIALKQA